MRMKRSVLSSRRDGDTNVLLDNSKSKGEMLPRDVAGWRKRFVDLMGFSIEDMTSWSLFTRLVNRPTHPAGLAVVRILYGIVMLFDMVLERGMAAPIEKWGDPYRCIFPVIAGLPVLPVEWMMMLYVCMCVGLIGMILGFRYRQSSLIFIIPFIYMYILNKMNWNNHSTLFLLLGVLLTLSDANRYWSLDVYFSVNKDSSHVPLWNYYLIRLQVFILYFISGLKKIHPDWLTSYSRDLGNKRAFAPFRLFLSGATINLVLVHIGGLLVDLCLGFLLFFDKTRPFGLFVGVGFHVMNILLFGELDMFPYMGIISLLIFCRGDWPVHYIGKWITCVVDRCGQLQPSMHCLYKKEDLLCSKNLREDGEASLISTRQMKTSPTAYHKMAAIFVLCYTAQQFFMPYSHFITKGYNSSWRSGMPGYSWDMMVHRVNASLVRIKYVEKDTGKIGYINKLAFITKNNRWNMYGDMTKEFASCIATRLEKDHNISNVAIYFDVLKSMNKRLFQRCIRPDVDILTAPWNLFQPTPWIMPLLHNTTRFRDDSVQRRKEVALWNNYTDIIYMADFPHMHTRHFVRNDTHNVNVTVIEGEITVELSGKGSNMTVRAGETFFNLPQEEYHTIHVTSPQPAVYYYMYVDARRRALDEMATRLSEKLQQQSGVTDEESLDFSDILPSTGDDATKAYFKQWIMDRRGLSLYEYTRLVLVKKSEKWILSGVGVIAALKSIWTGSEMIDNIAELSESVKAISEPFFLSESESYSLTNKKNYILYKTY